MHGHKDRRNDERDAMREIHRIPATSVIDLDPEDPTQLLDDSGQFSVVELDVEAQPSTDTENNEEPERTHTPDTGDLYGVYTQRRSEPDFDLEPEGDAFTDAELGEHWLETLGKKAAEEGAYAEAELEMIDDSDEHRGHHKSDTRDRPVADKGAGGRGGL